MDEVDVEEEGGDKGGEEEGEAGKLQLVLPVLTLQCNVEGNLIKKTSMRMIHEVRRMEMKLLLS